MSERQRVFLLESASGHAVEASLVTPLSDKHIVDWKNRWRPTHLASLKGLIAAGVRPGSGTQHSHWSWEKKEKAIKGLLAYQGYAIECNDVTQGMMVVSLTRTCRLPEQAGKPLVYVEFLEAAPWNRTQLGKLSQFRGVGSILIAAAVNLGHQEGFSGRIGLHSLPQADAFYRDKIGMTELGQDIDHNNLRYFEMTQVQAKALAERGSPR